MRIELFTDGIGALMAKQGRTFTAWEKDSSTYRQVEDEYGLTNIRITVDYKDVEKHSGFEGEYNVSNIESVDFIGSVEKELPYKYTVSYYYGEVGNSVGCYTPNQAKEVAEAIALRVKVSLGENAEVTIIDNETGESEKCYF